MKKALLQRGYLLLDRYIFVDGAHVKTEVGRARVS